MNSMFDDVVNFHQKILEVEPEMFPTWRGEDWIFERLRFLQEELDEMFSAAQSKDMVGVVDALLDTVYVALGTMYMMGIPVQSCWDAVQRANMSKVKGVGKRGNKIDAIKPSSWIGPEREIEAAIESARLTPTKHATDDAISGSDSGPPWDMP